MVTKVQGFLAGEKREIQSEIMLSDGKGNVFYASTINVIRDDGSGETIVALSPKKTELILKLIGAV